jgi:hypothetical protein
LACISSPSSMPMILRLVLESLSSCIFLSQLFSCLTRSLLFFL